MQPSPQLPPNVPGDPRRVHCATCEHTEFVHGDIDERRCLYSECRCSGFTMISAA